MQTDYPKISIVTPSYNQAEFIEETILSVLNQNYPNLEYIIIDGGSTDSSVEIIKKYEDKLHYWVSEKDKGQTHAINKGFEKASGTILAYLNSDDIYMPNALRLISDLFTKFEKVQWITGHKCHLLNQNVIAPVTIPNYKFNRELYQKGYHTPWLLGWNSQPCTFWTKELFEKAGAKFDESLQCSFDIDMWIKMSQFQDLYFLKIALTAMRQHKNQKSRTLQLDLKEIEGRANNLKFSPLWKRNVLTKMSRMTGFRKIARMILKNPKYYFFDWDIQDETWKVNSKNIF
jgi:glycosyltransferase involved in cell wall biosynthesis